MSDNPEQAVAALDLGMTRQFLDQFPGLVSFQAWGGPYPVKALHGTLEQHGPELIRLNQQGHSIGFMVNEGDGKGRSAENVTRVRAVFVDFDKPGGREKLKAANIEPHIIVESSPGNYHGYWFVDDCPLDQFTPLQERLAAHFDSDPGVNDLPRIMRLPGFLHMKGEPFQTRIVSVSEKLFPYSMAEIALLFIELPETIPENTRNKTLADIAIRDLRRAWLDDPADIKTALLWINDNRCDPKLSEKEVGNIAGSASKEKYEYDPVPKKLELPDYAFVVPNDHVSYPDAAKHIFTEIAKRQDMFLHGGAVSEITPHGLKTITGKEFPDRVDSYRPVMRYIRTNKGKLVLVSSRMPRDKSETLLNSKNRELLPSIRIITNAPIMTAEGIILSEGYHCECGGVYVKSGGQPEDVPLHKAVESLLGIHDDFKFNTRSDLSRAVAMLITPALKMGGFLNVPTPLDIAEADQSQAGKGYRHKIIAAIYRERRYMITQKNGGVGSLDESFCCALISGLPFICFDNIRGELNSQTLEAMITDDSSVRARAPFKGEVHVDARAVTIQVTSNAMKTTPDLANRSCVTGIMKQQRDYEWREYTEGDLLAHVTARQPFYLGCVFAVIMAWIRLGKPLSDTVDHDMRIWARSLDWITQNIFELPPLLDGHLEIQERVSNPYMDWLRSVCIVLSTGIYTAGEIAEAGVQWPGGREPKDAPKFAVGKIMKKLFRESEVVQIDKYTVRRITEIFYDEKRQETRPMKKYVIEDSENPSEY